MDYIELSINVKPSHPWTEILISDLADLGFESFSEENNALQAYVRQSDYQKDVVDQYILAFKNNDVEISVSEELIPGQNWNQNWESDFKPVKIENKLLIRAPFHEKETGFEEVIEIQPQMSFGTGHHQTTYLLSQVLLDINLTGKSVLDVGTGTGILGILASLKGAKKIIGTDIESGACDNARENIARNNVKNFSILEGDLDIVPNEKFDVIIANINKNVLKAHLKGYALRSKQNTILLLSGFFETDVDEMIEEAENVGYKFIKTYTKETWAVIEFKL